MPMQSDRLPADVTADDDVATDDGARVCLFSSGRRLGCAAREADDPSGDEQLVTILDRFHDTVFSPRVELTQSDLNSLDGRPQRIGADAAIKGMLGDGP